MSTRFISRRYARALFELIQDDAKHAGKLQEGLQRLAAVAENADAARVLASPSIAAEKKAQLLEKAAGKLPKELTNLVDMLCQRSKASLLPEIFELVEEMVLQSQSEVVADVRTASKLDAAALKGLKAALGKSVGRDVRLNVAEDKSLIGGLVVQIGDRQIDCSIRTRLEGMRRAIAN